MNKVMHVMKLMDNYDAPLLMSQTTDVIDMLWGSNEYSVRASLLQNIESILDRERSNKDLIEMLTTVKDELNRDFSNVCFELKLDTVKDAFNIVSHKLRECKKYDKEMKFAFYDGLADILYFYTQTNTFFTHNRSYPSSVKSIQMRILRRDIFFVPGVINNQECNSNDLN
jgi:hypothetical protein